MAEFEKIYYENEDFWKHEVLSEDDNTRVTRTIELLPEDINSVLDAGCGNGLFCNKLKEEQPNLRIIGMDRSESALKYLKTEKVVGSIDKIPFPDKTFDCVTSLQVLEHLPVNVFENALNELTRIAGKYIVVSVPFQEKVENRFDQCPSCKTIFNRDLHLRTFDEEKVTTLFEQFGFKCNHHETLIKRKKYLGIDAYAKFRKGSRLGFLSPICPLCGYAKPKSTQPEVTVTYPGNPVTKLVKKFISSVVKSLWPEVDFPGYWIIAVYEKK